MAPASLMYKDLKKIFIFLFFINTSRCNYETILWSMFGRALHSLNIFRLLFKKIDLHQIIFYIRILCLQIYGLLVRYFRDYLISSYTSSSILSYSHSGHIWVPLKCQILFVIWKFSCAMCPVHDVFLKILQMITSYSSSFHHVVCHILIKVFSITKIHLSPLPT